MLAPRSALTEPCDARIVFSGPSGTQTGPRYPSRQSHSLIHPVTANQRLKTVPLCLDEGVYILYSGTVYPQLRPAESPTTNSGSISTLQCYYPIIHGRRPSLGTHKGSAELPSTSVTVESRDKPQGSRITPCYIATNGQTSSRSDVGPGRRSFFQSGIKPASSVSSQLRAIISNRHSVRCNTSSP